MTILLKQSTASQEIPLGPFLDSTDGNTAEPSLTIANTDLNLWKAGATTLASKNSGGATHISGGIYYAVLDATDTDTLGPLIIFCHPTGALAVKVECLVLPANVYDSLVTATDKLEVDAVAISGDAGAADNLEAAADGTGYNLGNGSIVAASVTGAVASVTGNVGGNVAGSIGSLGAQAKLDVNAEADTALTDYDAATNADLTAGLAALNDPTAAAVADAVWDEAKAGHVAAGSFGEEVQSHAIPGDAMTLAAGSVDAAAVNTGAIDADALAADAAVEIAAAVWDRVLSGATHNVTNSAGRRLRSIPETIGSTISDLTPSALEFDTGLAGGYTDDHFNDQIIRFTSGTLAGQVGVIVDYADTAGTITLEEPLTAAPANGDEFEVLSTHVHPKSQIAGAVWDQAKAGHVAAGSFGEEVQSHAIPGDAMTLAAGAVNAAAVGTDAFDADALSADALAEIKAQVVAALASDGYATITDLPAAGAVNEALGTMIRTIYTHVINKLDQDRTSGVQTLYDRDGTTPIGTSTITEDGTTITRGQWADSA